MNTFASLFTGGGGADVGAARAGLRHLWGVEYDARIAGVAELNGFATMVTDICAVDFSALAAPYWLHMSPPCTRASQANANAEESPLDQALADACIRAIRTLRPRRISLENVWGYRNFQAFRSILATLAANGYSTDFWHLNAADYGGLKPCPYHDVNVAINPLAREIAPDIVALAAMMRPADQARLLAWDAMAHLVKATSPATADAATWQNQVSVGSQDQPTLTGEAVDMLTIEDISAFASMAGINVNTVLLLRECLTVPSWKARWFTTSTETRRITIHLISRCLQTTVNTQRSIMPSDEKGNECPLCEYSATPQTRKRLMLCASLDHQPRRPLPTHEKTPNPFDMFALLPWRGWYAAIEDLIPTLPDSAFAPWQLERLPAELKETMLVNGDSKLGMYESLEPAPTIKAGDGRNNTVRAFVVHPTNMQAMPVRNSTDPMFTITAGGDLSARNMFSPRAFVIGGGNTNTTEDRPRTPRYADDPMFTVSRSSDRDRAFIVAGENQSNGSTARLASEPAYTLTSSAKGTIRAYVGRVVKMTPRCLARFNGLADTYRLPDSPTLACTVLGNMVPPDLEEALIRANP